MNREAVNDDVALNMTALLKRQGASGGAGQAGQVYRAASRSGFEAGLLKSWEQGLLVDCHVTVRNGKTPNPFKAHKIVLASHSETLSRLISEQESGEPVLQLKVDGHHPELIGKMLQFMYTGEVNISDATVVDLFTTAVQFGCHDLQKLCEQHVSAIISSETVIPLMLDAEAHHAETLKRKCLGFFEEHAEEVFDQPHFRQQLLHMPKPLIISILSVDFRMDEHKVFQFAVEWAEAFCAKNEGTPFKEAMVGLSECIRYISLNKHFLQKKVLPMGILSDKVMLDILFHKAKDPVFLQFEESAEEVNQNEVQQEETAVWLKPRRSTWKTMDDFTSEEEYAVYLKSVLQPGMLLTAVRTYENVTEGDVGEFVQWNTGFPPCQIRWHGYGNTYWLHWRDVAIMDNPP